MTGSEIHRCSQTLRLHLLDMCRGSQQCVDYSIKALQRGRWDFSVLDKTYEMSYLHDDIKEIACDLLLTELSSETDVKFVLASMRISDVLQAIQKKAFEIVEILILQNEGKTDCADVATTGDLANRMMRLCTVALFEEEVEHSEVALRMERMEAKKRLVAATAGVPYRDFEQRSPLQAAFVLAMAGHLDELIAQIQEMARAIVFWLDGNKRELAPRSFGSQPYKHFVASSRSVSEFEPEYCI